MRFKMDNFTKENQYNELLNIANNNGLSSLGLMTNQVWHEDPRRLAIILSRYKFVSKMLSGRGSVVEIGCADAFGTRIVQQEVKNISVLDFDPIFINDVKDRLDKNWPLNAMVHDILDGPIPFAPYEAAYSLDVLEHINKKHEDIFLNNIVKSLNINGVLIIGTPSIYSQDYASKQSREGHINCKSSEELKYLLEKYFYNVFIFSMNDEVVHTGFYPMAHYYFALCSGVKSE
tara:strand:- start:2251 stop:2946 length:696 start_codon:yes stop_codon:yes gene_type:complete